VEIAERLEEEDSAQALIAGARAGVGRRGERPRSLHQFARPARAARIARIAPQRGHASTSMSKAPHQIGPPIGDPLGAGVASSLASEHALATTGASAGNAP